MILMVPSAIRGIAALTKQATGRALHTSQLAMAPIKVTKRNYTMIKLHNCRLKEGIL